ncbi:MAG: PTS glucose transporter subunit IIA [Tetragenococcus halophilus]|uniref:PTS glucose transporter subunit IIA n=2 Tax=Tetragenococcus halophilus TaxID=51669 RepID=A0A3G5FGG3_TETHA|nr:PTS glucose transporter subunit IIA [Tetragenococcus halophilus]AYW49437.1 sugar permease [Tetragenococcus halophilus]MCF1601824.1 PTS glucose transporter subunit IIA [Tetragenococcus halophilus]MCO7027295.1 PTS glucose transporter subunit IIA [Tetragenococcus halophilus]MCO8289144.1 PTS glucose transporter subunit IIA [Tetragenococcus halophilus]MCT8311346.1 PTS glucose transporter subunit IIA [Tetragenococcus halophilus]
MFSFLKKKKTALFSPADGQLVPLSKVEDPVFSQGMMGPGIAVLPSSDDIYSPVEGTVSNVFPTKHAIGLKTKDGKEVLLHFGIDTVELKGEGFEVFVDVDDKVQSDTLLARMDRAYLKEQEKIDTLMVLFPEEKEFPSVEEKAVNAKDELFELD